MQAVAMIAQTEAGDRGGNNNPHGANQHKQVNDNNVNIDQNRESGTGNATTYAMRRLAKDAPQEPQEPLHAPIAAADAPTYFAALATRNDDRIHQHDERIADHDRRLSQVENNTRLIVALVAGFIAGAVLVGILAALVMLR